MKNDTPPSVQGSPRSPRWSGPFPGRLLGLILLGGLALPLSSGAQEGRDALIARSFEARGGIEAWRGVETARLRGKLSMAGREGEFRVELKLPDKVRVELELGEVVHIQVRDGDTGWSQQTGVSPLPPRPLDEVELVSLRQQSDLAGPLLDWQAKGHRVALEGPRKVSGRDVHTFRVTLADGEVQRIDLDAERLLEVRIHGTRTVGGQEVDYLQLPGDYRPVGGLLLPHALTQHIGNLTQHLEFFSIELNVPIADARFLMPRN
jgi:hypothetical protein